MKILLLIINKRLQKIAAQQNSRPTFKGINIIEMKNILSV